MLLNQTIQYALRAMSVLAALRPGHFLTATQLAESASVPPHYLSKVMRRLVLADLVEGTKGHGGGFTLHRPASQIRFREIVEAVSGPLEADACAFGWGQCNARKPCPLHVAFESLNSGLDEWLDGQTLDRVAGHGLGAARGRTARKA
ncbi:MAG: Rrf2 family transcriptional regulator [Planctomycetes bacterium]|nr:Rrf2 family transcriptional regulator [Planctomycetota bacterium]